MYITGTSSGRFRMRGDAVSRPTDVSIYSGQADKLSDNREDEEVGWISQKPYKGNSEHDTLGGLKINRLSTGLVTVMYITVYACLYKRQGINDFDKNQVGNISIQARRDK